MRREPVSRPENRLAWAEAEIERLKALTTRITNGRSVVIVPGDPGTGTTPPVEASEHVLYGSKHTRSLAVAAAEGVSLNVSVEQGQVWVNGVFFSVAATSLLMVDATTNYVFVNSAGAVAQNTTGFPTSGIPLATVVTAGGDITSVNDRRAYLNAGAWNSITGILTTRGDLLTRDATQLVRLGIGAAGSILRSDGLDPAWTINPTIAGYMRLGSVAAPANVTAGDLTFVRAFVNNDSLFNLAVNLGNPRVTFDAGDYWEFDRAANGWNNYIGAAGTYQVQIAGAIQILAGTSQVQLLGDTTSFDSTGIIQIGNDTDFALWMNGANPRFSLASGDYLEYNRANNDLVLVGGAAAPAQLRFTIDARAQAGASAVLYFISEDGYAGPAWFRESAVDTRLKWSLETPLGVAQDPDLVLHRFTGGIGAEVRAVFVTFNNDGSGIHIGVDGASPALVLHAIDGVSEGGELQLLGAAANADWTFDNYAGVLRYIAGGVVEFAIAATYYEQDIEAAMPAAATAGSVRGFPFTTTGRDVPFWRDDGGFQYAAPEKMRAFIPKPMLPTTGAGAGFGASTTTAAVGLVNIPSPMELTRLSYRVTVAGANADNVMRFAIYSEDGQQKFLDVTHAVGVGTGEQTVTFAAVWLGPGNYYLFACLSSGTAPGPTFICWTTDDIVFVAGAAGEPDLEGNHTVVGGAAPATFDPTAITTPFRNSTLYCRLDGAA